MKSGRGWAMVCAAMALACAIPGSAQQVDRYVWTNSPSPGTPFSTWETAAHEIQPAVDAAVAANGDQVIVRAGVYDQGGTLVVGLTNRVYVNKAITVRSEDNDPATTMIKGAWDPVTTNGPAAVRPVYLQAAGARLVGFTLTNGATLGLPAANTVTHCGGGVYANAAIISNCVIVGNVSQSYSGNGGGGAWGGTFHDSKFIHNSFANNPSHPFGGGTFGATLYRCHLTGNTAGRGGGASGGTLYDCVVSNNVARHVAGWAEQSQGGGTRLSTVYDSIIVDNAATLGGGVTGGRIENSLIRNNTGVGGGGGTDASVVVGSLVVSNVIAGASVGAGVRGGTVSNSIVAFNTGGLGGGIGLPSRVASSLVYGHNGYGGGIWLGNGSVVESATVVGNTRGFMIEGTAQATVYNSIVYHNELQNWVTNPTASSITFHNTCTTPAYSGWDASNITADPEFVSMGSGYGLGHIPGNYRLRGGSPALNAGAIRSWMGESAVDLDGNPRRDKITGIPDMGCYERVYTGTTLIIR